MSQTLLTINYKNTSNRAIAAFPVTQGVPLPEGTLRAAEGLAVRLADGSLQTVQAKALESWFDGSIKWLLLDFTLPVKANESGSVALVQAQAAAAEAMQVAETDDALTVTTPQLQATISKKEFSLFASYRVDGKEMLAPGSDIILEDLEGKRYYASQARAFDVQIIVRGVQRIVVQVSGRHTAEDDAEMLDFRVRYTFRPQEPGVGIAYKFTNREAPETGVKFSTAQIVIPTVMGKRTAKFVRQSNHGKSWNSRIVEVRENVELIAGKALNAEAVARYGAAAEGKILIRSLASLQENVGEYPYFLRPGNKRTDMSGGLRSMYPHLMVRGEGGSLVAWFYDMEINYPKGVRCDRNTVTFDIWPAVAGELHVRRGQSKEHELYLCFAGERTPEEMEGIYFDHEIVGYGVLGAAYQPVEITLDPDYVRGCKVLQLDRWLRYDLDSYTDVEVKLGSANAKGSIGSKGMWDAGDYISPDRSWAHNNEDDAILNGIREYFRRAEPTMLTQSVLKAKHNAHVDFIAFDPDPLRQGTMPAHCPEHTDGATYPSHMWVDGLMAAYCVTGETDLLEAALSVGENMLRWQQTNPGIFYADSRECGWPALAFLRMHEYTGEQKWLDGVQEVFEFYKTRMSDDGVIYYELPHGVATYVAGYGEFIGWRSLFFYYERTQKPEVKEFLAGCLDKVYKFKPGPLGGWACNDLFPAWAAYALTGDDKYIEDNYPFLRFLMQREGGFPWGGNDMHFYLGELDRRGKLAEFCAMSGVKA